LLYTIVMKPSDAPTSIDVSTLLPPRRQQRPSETGRVSIQRPAGHR